MTTSIKLFPALVLFCFMGWQRAFAQTQGTIPGGISATDYTLDLWLTPDEYNSGVWASKTGTAVPDVNFSSAGTNATAPARVSSGGFNFHPALQFTANTQRLATTNVYDRLSTGIYSPNSYFIFTVSKPRISTSSSDYFTLITLDGANTNRCDLYWRGGISNFFGSTWRSSPRRNSSTGDGDSDFGILSVFQENNLNTSTPILAELNGKPFTLDNAGNGPASAGGKIVIGSSLATSSSSPFSGYLQEVIVMKKSGRGNKMDAVDIQKINSYLAIKYGLTLNNADNYLLSDGTVVWDRTVTEEEHKRNWNFNHHIFGIGRWDATGLYQKQSRSQTGDLLTAFAGALAPLNDDNTATLKNGVFAMFGSNNRNPASIASLEDELTIDPSDAGKGSVNYITGLVYKAKVTSLHPSDIHPVYRVASLSLNLEVDASIASQHSCLLLSYPNSHWPSPFSPENTRVFPISPGSRVVECEVLDGAYIAFGGTIAGGIKTPGGVNNPNYEWRAWLTPDSYNRTAAGTWDNLFTGLNSVGRFIKQDLAPAKTNTGYNFHPAVNFSKSSNMSAPNRLATAGEVKIAANENITAIVVYDRLGNVANTDYLFSFADGSTVGNLVFSTNNSNNLNMQWPGVGGSTVLTANAGIATVDNANNSASNSVHGYLNGVRGNSLSATATDYTSKWTLGGAGSTYQYYGFRGNIQEVILLKAAGESDNHVKPVDLQKIHSYLAIKYGITLGGGGHDGESDYDYLLGSGQRTDTVWNRTRNAGYNHNIFGIGRNDVAGLNQRQSRSVDLPAFTVFVGDHLAPLNSSNPTSLNDDEYALFGSNTGSLNGVEMLTGGGIPIPDNNTQQINYRRSLVYRAQITGAPDGLLGVPTLPLKLRVEEGMVITKYVLVSVPHILTPATPNTPFLPANTIAIPVPGSKVIEGDIPDGAYITFGGYISDANTLPGGITSQNLKLWLDAASAASIVSTQVADNTGVLAGYPARYPSDDKVNPVNGMLTAVSEWKDHARGVTYGSLSGERNPVYSATPLEMNYHPSLMFWGSTSLGARLVNSSGLFSNAIPGGVGAKPYEHTAIFVVNNQPPVSSDRTYYMSFNNSNNTGLGYHPVYGLKEVSPNVYPMMNFSTDRQYDSQNLPYKIGSTSVMSYRTDNDGSNSITYGVNGKSTRRTGLDFGTLHFDYPSTLGIGFSRDRQLNGLMAEVIIFEEKLSDNNMAIVESYLGAKYGITLHSNTGNGNFDYIMKAEDPNNPGSYIDRIFWPGKTNPSFAVFHNNVASVIQDVSMLSNIQSHSTDVGSLVHMAVAGSRLDLKGQTDGLGNIPHVGDAITWGHNGRYGSTAAPPDECNKFNWVFNRKWLVYKQTTDSKISMLVGVQNNSDNNLGKESQVKADYYSKLTPDNKIYMLVAEDSTAIDPTHANYGAAQYNFKMIPMTCVNKEHQCNYAFTTDNTYITFAYSNPNPQNQTANAKFEGAKTLLWQDDWKYSQLKDELGYPNRSSDASRSVSYNLGGATTISGSNQDITANVKVTYPAGVYAPYGYPHAATSDPRGALQLRRITPNTSSVNYNDKKVTVTVEFNDLVRPEFSISGIGGYDPRCCDSRYARYDKVTVTGANTAIDVAPQFITMGTNPYFTASDKVIASRKSSTTSASDKNGIAGVRFEHPVNKIVIEYELTGADRYYSSTQINISPIVITSAELATPPAPINEDGLGFTKEVKTEIISACETVEYVYRITNTNNVPKIVKFYDELPIELNWQDKSIGLDTLNSSRLKAGIVAVNNYGNGQKLQIDSLLVPCGATIELSATAIPDELLIPAGQTVPFKNQAEIFYLSTRQGVTNYFKEQSSDRTTGRRQQTTVYVAGGSRYQPVKITRTDPTKQYLPDDTVTVKLQIDNPSPNDALHNVFMNIGWGSRFTYVANSLTVDNGVACTVLNPEYSGYGEQLIVANSSTGDAGFTLPAGGPTTVTFQLKAPDVNNLNYFYDENGNQLKDVNPLIINYNFFMESVEPCVLAALDNAFGDVEIPYLHLHVDAVYPKIGPATGGTYTGSSATGSGGINTQGSITLLGGGFQIDVPTVKFGNEQATVLAIYPDSLICIPPPFGKEGPVDITVTLRNTDALLRDSFTYRAPMSIQSVTPNNGPTRGATTVQITGHNFLPPALPNITPQPLTLSFAVDNNDNNPAPANIIRISNDTLFAATTEHLANRVNITVDNHIEKRHTTTPLFTYYPTTFVEDGNWSDYLKWEDHSDENIVPSDWTKIHNQVGTIHIKANIIQDQNLDLDSITLHPGQSYTVGVGRELKTNVFTIKDNASFLNQGTDAIVQARAQHTLDRGRNWYLSSPTQGSAPPAIASALGHDADGNPLQTWRVEWYNEPNNNPDTYQNWVKTNPGDPFLTARGYTAYSEHQDIAANFTGRFTDGDQTSPPLHRTGNTHPRTGYNLVGNPYPSYWRWTAEAAAAAHTYSTIWYRTHHADHYVFWTHNASGNVSVAPGYDDNHAHTGPYSLALIPPLQAFWVRLQDGAATGALPFANAHRSHANHAGNQLKTAAADTPPQQLRLTVVNTAAANQVDETLVYTHPQADNNFDAYDSDKLFTAQGPQIYTQVGADKRELAINGLPKITDGQQIPLGFQTDAQGVFALRANQITNLSQYHIQLLDKWNQTAFDLHSGKPYTFSAGSVPVRDRFLILFTPRPADPFPADAADPTEIWVAYANKNRQIVVLLQTANPDHQTENLEIYNIAGRKLAGQTIKTGHLVTLNHAFPPGAYVLRAGSKTTKVIVTQ